MPDLADRLAVLAPGPSRDVDLAFVRTRARSRRRRRTGVLGAAGAVVLAVATLGIAQVVAGESGETNRVIAAAGPDAVPAGWGGPTTVIAGDDELFVQFDQRQLVPSPQAGIARLDPASGALTAVAPVAPSSEVVYAAGSLWVHPFDGGRLDRLDPATGEVTGSVDLPADALGRLATRGGDVWWVGAGQVALVDTDALRADVVATVELGPQFTEPLALDDEVWVGQDHGLLRIGADGVVDRFDGPQTGDRIYGLAFDGTRLWVASSTSADAPSVVGWIDPTTSDLEAPLTVPHTVPGTVDELGIVDDVACVGLNTLLGQSALCGALPTDGPDPLVLDRWPVDESLNLDGSAWAVLDGAWWGTLWSDGLVRRVDAATLRGDDVVDLSFDGQALMEEASRPIGPEVTVSSGDLPGDLGRWRLVAYETATDICTRVHTRFGAAGGCDRKTDDPQVFSATSGDGSGSNGEPPWVAATMRPDVALVRLELDDDSVVELHPVDVGFPVTFAYAQLPNGVQVRRTVALDAEGEVLQELLGLYFAVPD
jgi:hypothetical protein